MFALRRRVVWAVVLLAALAASADTVILKNGSSFDGTILEETDDRVVISIAGGSLTFPKTDVVRITRDPGTRPKNPPPDEPETPPSTPGDPVPVPPAAEAASGGALGPADLARVPQSPRVTLEARQQPLPEVLEELSQQAAFRFTPPFSGSAKGIDLRAEDAPLWEAVLSICRQGPWGLCVVQDSSYEGLVLRIDDDDPILVADIQGPAMLAGHGLVKESVFDGAGAWVDKDGIKFSLWIDPNGRMRILEPRLDPQFFFTFEDGRQIQIQADKETQFMLNGRSWFFEPSEELSGAAADVRLRIPIYGAVAISEATLPWRAGASGSSAEAEVTVREVKSENVEVRDEKDWFEKKKVDQFTATVHVIHSAGKLMARLSEERRQATTEEQKLLQLPPEAMAVECHEVWIVGEDGRRLRATLDDAAGISSPWHGKASDATIRVEEPGFVPKEIVVRWAHDFRRFELEFLLKDLPLRAR